MAEDFSIQAQELLAYKLCADYLDAVRFQVRGTEPELFFEQWTKEHIFGAKEPFIEGIWKAFIRRLRMRLQYLRGNK